MRPSLPAVKALLDGWSPTAQIRIVDLYTITLAGGGSFRFSGFQTALQAPPPNAAAPLNTFVLGPKFRRSRIKEMIGTQVDELEIDIYAGEHDLLGTLTWQQAIHAGLFDGAYCRLDRGYLAPPGSQVVGTITRFYGRVGDVDIGRTKIAMRVKSLLDLLTVQMPKRLYQAQCDFVFGDAMCGYDRAAGKNALGVSTGIGAVTIAALAGSDQNSIKTGFVPSPATAYDNGSIIGTSGQNDGFTRNIGKLSGGTVYFLKPWIFPVATGDGFQLLPGCPHTLAYCTSPLQNQARYGGFPYIPPPETAV